ncbi:MAG: dihydrolipoyl dehydrogenase [Deltaproteobacteria bacterium]|jgi:dihydrolipoamide dehydrogenase|nr:dihydrolipoyl dehydrogenase [Deltaproteobacteria bacterium]
MSLKVVVVGAGPGGYSGAVRARQLGAEVTLVDKDRPGGTCLNRGCIPSKIMRRAADLLRESSEGAPFGVSGDGVRFSLQTLRARQKQIVDGQADGLAKHFKALGITYVSGSASIKGPGLVTVAPARGGAGEAADHAYDRLLVASGSEPVSLPGMTVDGESIITSDQALWTEDLPESLLVVGGGVIGCELAQIFHQFGVKTTIVEALDRLLPLPGVDEEISKVFMRSLKKIKLPFLTGQTVAEVRREGGELAAVVKPFKGEGEAREIRVRKILLSVGRKASLGGLDLASLGVKLDARGWVEADEYFQTAAPNVYAVGDCLGPARIMLAHAATAEAMSAVENMISGTKKTVDYQSVPSAVFTSPEIGCVGLSLAQAREKHPEAVAKDFLFRQLGKAQAMGETDGVFRLVAGPDGAVLGAHIIGAQAASLLGEVSLAVSKKMRAEDLASVVHAHPTLPEGIWEAALALAGRPLHG